MRSMWPKDTLESQSMPIWIFAAAALASRDIEVAAARCSGADKDGVVALEK
jgi:hypothetical protein